VAYENLLLERRGHVALVTLNRPERLNALNAGLRDEILEVCHEVEDDDSLRALVFTGTGRGFSAGADLSGGPRPSSEDGPPPQGQRLDEYGWVGRQASTVAGVTKPTIAAMNGVAVGAGMSLSLACDMRVGCPDTRFKTVFLERNLSPDSGMSYFLPRIVGYSRAADLLFTSREVDADEAYRIGLLDRLVPADRLVDEALAVANQIAALPPLAMRAAKRALQRNQDRDLHEALLQERLGLFYSRLAPNDARESRMSFVEKRPAQFTGT